MDTNRMKREGKKNIHLLWVLLLLCCGCGKELPQSVIIPKPLSEEYGQGTFVLNKETQLYVDVKGEERELLLSYLKQSPMGVVKELSKPGTKNCINLLLTDGTADFPSAESYELNVSSSQVTISATGGAGLFYGIQSLLQLMQEDARTGEVTLAAVHIKDSPRFPYRGLHLDVSRHFRSKEFVMKQLDMMAYYKLNRFHWHLTDGAGWRIEIKKYPLLTDVAAWRPYNTWKEWWQGGRKYCTKDDPKAQGGFYTQEDVKEVVAYAAQRFITVIPEIEMPGHSEEVLAVYPQLSCAGKPYVNSDFCIGNEEAFAFLEDVLTEVIALFPSEYIHIGGDEASKEGWKTCSKCKARMKAEQLKDVDELQSYLIHRMEKFLHSKGRRLLGWDEILQGGLAPDATVMSWRGEEGGIVAVQAGHHAIMSPGEFCYFDAYQDDPDTQPEAIGGFLSLEKVYSYNPIPDSLATDKRDFILGVQANVWAEYIPTSEHMEYMIYPRLLALSEVAWSALEQKSWPDFKRRVNKAIPFLEQKGYHPYTLSKDVVVKQLVNQKAKCMEITLESELDPIEIRYTLDGTEPVASSPCYTEPIRVDSFAMLSTCLFRGGKALGKTSTKRIDYHKGIGRKITYQTNYYKQYAAGGDSALVDGYRGGKGYGDGRWQGFCPKDMDVIIDLEQPTQIHRVMANFMQIIGPWVFMPSSVEVSISMDGKEFQPLVTVQNEIPITQDGVIFRDFGYDGDEVTARYVRYVAHQSEREAFIFTDEITIQ